MSRKLVTAGVVAAALAAVFAGVSSLNGERRPAADAPGADARPPVVAAEGKVSTEPGSDVDVGSELYARIESVPVKEGERVAAGQVVTVLANADFEARLAQAEAELRVAQARYGEAAAGSRAEEKRAAAAVLDGARAAFGEADRQLQRYRHLHAQGMVSDAAVDERELAQRAAAARLREAQEQKSLVDQGTRAETLRLLARQVAGAEAAVAQARRELEKTVLRSPISGTVIRRYLDPGEAVTPEIPILRIANTDQLKVNAEIDEYDLGRFKLGDPVEVRSQAFPGKVFRGSVEHVGGAVGARRQLPDDPAINLGLKVVETRIALEEPAPLSLGMTVDVRILGSR